MDGVLVIDKPDGPTSHDVVARVRRILKTRRVGHAGTLDPFATGVMVILIGKATRLAQFVDKDEKEYIAEIRFGFRTDTGDRTGERVASEKDSAQNTAEILGNISDWNTVFDAFRGEIEQTPPMYSAKKIDGKKLYELARKGIEVERRAVPVTIRELEFLPDRSHADEALIAVRVVCSAGTYIRTLAEDIGRKIGIGAHVSELRRTRSGSFDISMAITLEELEERSNPADVILPVSAAAAALPKTVLTPDRVERTRNGLATSFEEEAADGQMFRMENEAGELVAIGTFDRAGSVVRPKVVLI